MRSTLAFCIVSVVLIALFHVLIFLAIHAIGGAPVPAPFTDAFLDALLSYSELPLAQALLGASFGATAAYAATIYHAARTSRRDMSIRIIAEVHAPAFIEIRSNAVTHLETHYGLDDRIIRRPVSLARLFSIEAPGADAAGRNAVRSVFAQIEQIGDLASNGLVHRRLLATSLHAFLEIWIEAFDTFVDRMTEDEKRRWKTELASLDQARELLAIAR